MKEELPEHQIFHVLRRGEEDPMGPFSQNELVELLNRGEVRPTDFVYYPQLVEWTPFAEVFDLHQGLNHIGSEGQDPESVMETFAYMEKRSEQDENIYYIAVQKFASLSLTATIRMPQSVILTNTRFCVYKPKLMGDPAFEEIPVSAIEKVEAGYDGDYGIFEIVPRFGDPLGVNQIPVAQLERLEEVAGDLLSHPS